MPQLYTTPNHRVLNTNTHILMGVSLSFICIFWQQGQTLITTITLRYALSSFRLNNLSLQRKQQKKNKTKKRTGEREREGTRERKLAVVTLLFQTNF